ncbi:MULTISPECIES: hypothetical protein [unclassified Streptomyces]|uniref:hypothetical protein n=1 Tax=unclassified Streptomyces TaxID=2593676 RepID=UPI0040420BC1
MGNSLKVDYAITSPSGAVLSVPIAPTAPTALLLHAGKIVGYQHTGASNTVDGRAPEGYRLTKPYTGKLPVNVLCAGTTWARIRQQPQSYTAVIVMSKQPESGPQTAKAPSYHADPLSVSQIRL